MAIYIVERVWAEYPMIADANNISAPNKAVEMPPNVLTSLLVSDEKANMPSVWSIRAVDIN